MNFNIVRCRVVRMIALLIWFFQIEGNLLIGQDDNIDSLKSILKNKTEQDTEFVSTLFKISDYYAYRGEDISRNYIERLKEFAATYESQKAQNYYYSAMATLMHRQNKPDSAQYFWKLELENSQSDSFQIARIYLEMTGPQLRALQYDSMEYYTTMAIGIANRHSPDNKKFLASCYNTMGIANDIKEDHENAIKFYAKSIELKEEIGAKSSAANSYMNLATIYSRVGNTEQSLYNDKKALKIGHEVKNNDIIANALHSLGVTYKNSKEYDLAQKYLLEALDIRTKTKELYERCFTLYALGNLKREMRDFKASIEYYDRAIVACEEVGNDYTMANVLINKSRTLLKLGQYTSAQNTIDRAIKETNKLQVASSIMHAYQVKSEVEQKLGNNLEAYSFLQDYHLLHDSIQEQRRNKDVQELQLKYESKEKQAIIKDQELELVKTNHQKNLLLYGLLSLGAVSFLIIKRYRQNKLIQNEQLKNLKREQKLLAIDSMLNGQQEERKRIAQELHDGLGGLLTSARLQMQKIDQEMQKLEDLNLLTSTEELIDNACTEVRRIAHDMMPAALVNLGFVDAIWDLAVNIEKTGKLKVNTYFSDPNINLSDKQSLMLFRIVQEASNNTLKYANAKALTIQCISEKDYYFLTIEDDGQGIDNDKVENGKGMLNIKSRVQYLEGEIEIINSNTGLSYEIKIPRHKD